MKQIDELLELINKEIPKGVDWKAGARRYLEAMFSKHSRPGIERYSFTKPLGQLPLKNSAPALLEDVSYLRNFTETVALLALPGGATVLDVACGGGWLSHWLMRMGYAATGFDIAEDFVELARQRVREDHILGMPSASCNAAFFVHDIEENALPAAMKDTFDAAILESCLHHFVNPVAALRHIGATLKEGGVLMVIEGENRAGKIADGYMQVMRDLDTLERPYERAHLVEALALAGLPEVEFVGPVPGWMSLNDPLHPHLTEHHKNVVNAMNLCVAAKNRDALQRIFPWRR